LGRGEAGHTTNFERVSCFKRHTFGKTKRRKKGRGQLLKRSAQSNMSGSMAVLKKSGNLLKIYQQVKRSRLSKGALRMSKGGGGEIREMGVKKWGTVPVASGPEMYIQYNLAGRWGNKRWGHDLGGITGGGKKRI